MEQTGRDQAFYAAIADEAHLPESDAQVLVADFLDAISRFIGDDAWGTLLDLVPDGPEVDRKDGERTEGTIEDFLLEMSDVESVEAGRAAEHARIVAEKLRSRADESHLERLRESIENEELLALFELRRGELTEPEMPTAGERAQSGELTQE